MTAFHFSLRWLLAGVVFVAVACAGLVYPSPLYASLLAATLLAILATALVAALVSPGRYRALGLGMLVFAGCYGLALWKFEWAVRFTDVLDDAYSRLSGLEAISLSDLELERNKTRIKQHEEWLRGSQPNSSHHAGLSKELANLRRSVDASQGRQSFIGVAYCLLALVAAGCGALVAGWFYDRRENTPVVAPPRS